MQTPWEILSETQISQTTLLGDKLYEDLLEEKECDFELPDPEDVADKFFERGRADLRKLGSIAHIWIIHEITGGRVRSDKNKAVFTFNRTPKGISGAQQLFAIKKNKTTKFWKRLEVTNLDFIISITECANEVYEIILQRFVLLSTGRDFCKNSLTNFRRLPEFVAFQTYRNHAHKNHIWSYMPVPRGGNQPLLKPSKSIPHRIQSVHYYLKNYHRFLGKITRVVN